MLHHWRNSYFWILNKTVQFDPICQSVQASYKIYISFVNINKLNHDRKIQLYANMLENMPFWTEIYDNFAEEPFSKTYSNDPVFRIVLGFTDKSQPLF